MKSAVMSFVGRHRFLMGIVSICAVCVAGLIEVVAARRVGIADWYMHLAMWVLLASYFVLTTWTVALGKSVRSWVNVGVLEAVTVFWVVVLASKVPGERLVIDGQLTQREPLFVAWLSIVVLVLCALFMPVLTAVGLSQARRENLTNRRGES
jgi:hypothetical protein